MAWNGLDDSDSALVVTTMSGTELIPPESLLTVGALRVWVAAELSAEASEVDLAHHAKKLDDDSIALSSLGSVVQVTAARVLVRGDLPDSLHALLVDGVISRFFARVLATSWWIDEALELPAITDSVVLVENLRECQGRSLGVITRHLPPRFQAKEIRVRSFPSNAEEVIIQLFEPSLRWIIQEDVVQSEMLRQNSKEVDIKFCLDWHAHECDVDGRLIRDLNAEGGPICTGNQTALAALVQFSVLENMDFISRSDGGQTLLSEALRGFPRDLQELGMIVLWMFSLGVISEEPYDAIEGGIHTGYGGKHEFTPIDEDFLLLSRVMSIVPVQVRSDMPPGLLPGFDADQFDLISFHSLAKAASGALNQQMEASLLSVLLRDPSNISLIPKQTDMLHKHHWLPRFDIPLPYMGILVRFFLEYDGDAKSFHKEVLDKFPWCAQPCEDLLLAIRFFSEVQRCLEYLESGGAGGAVGNNELFKRAEKHLARQQRRLLLVDEVSKDWVRDWESFKQSLAGLDANEQTDKDDGSTESDPFEFDGPLPD